MASMLFCLCFALCLQYEYFIKENGLVLIRLGPARPVVLDQERLYGIMCHWELGILEQTISFGRPCQSSPTILLM